MFHRHFDDYVHHSHGGPGHHGFGRGPFRGWRSRGGNAGGREGRMFDGGELRLVILALIAEKPRYGYEIIKELGERVGGDYSPSPGVVYPTLTMLEEMGYAQASQDPQGRKLYGLTPEGEKVLADNKAQIDAIFARFGDGDDALRGFHLGQASDAQSALRASAAPARPRRDARADPGDRRRARRGGQGGRARLTARSGRSRHRQNYGLRAAAGLPISVLSPASHDHFRRYRLRRS